MFAVLVLLPCVFNTVTVDAKDRKHLPGIPPDVVASYLHSIIKADRTIYSTFIVNRLHEKGILSADEAWEQKNALPLPAQFLQQSGRLVAETGTGIRFRLISLWPIYERNGPVTDFERTGLQTVAKHPDQPYEGVVQSGKLSYFQAIYAYGVTLTKLSRRPASTVIIPTHLAQNEISNSTMGTYPFSLTL